MKFNFVFHSLRVSFAQISPNPPNVVLVPSRAIDLESLSIGTSRHLRASSHASAPPAPRQWALVLVFALHAANQALLLPPLLSIMKGSWLSRATLMTVTQVR